MRPSPLWRSGSQKSETLNSKQFKPSKDNFITPSVGPGEPTEWPSGEPAKCCGRWRSPSKWTVTSIRSGRVRLPLLSLYPTSMSLNASRMMHRGQDPFVTATDGSILRVLQCKPDLPCSIFHLIYNKLSRQCTIFRPFLTHSPPNGGIVARAKWE